jgi:hypothetical protein
MGTAPWQVRRAEEYIEAQEAIAKTHGDNTMSTKRRIASESLI